MMQAERATPITERPIQVALLDDHRLILEGLAERINAQPDMETVMLATTADDALQGLLEMRPHVALLDVELPGRGVFDMAAQLRVRQKDTRLVFLTGYVSDVFIEQAIKMRAHGYLVKGESIGFILNCIRRVANGEQCFSDDVQRRLAFNFSERRYVMRSDSPFAQLTSRQLEVLRQLAKGASVKEVAKLMHLSQKSVDSHKYRIMHKLGIHDRVQLARFAIREGLMLP